MQPFDPRSFPINEQASGTYSGTLTGNDGVLPLPLASILTLTLTLYAIIQNGTEAIVNGRNAQNVLNANNVTVDAGGNLTWSIQPADTTLVEVLPVERHYALFQWTWAAGAGKHEAILSVRNLRRVP